MTVRRLSPASGRTSAQTCLWRRLSTSRHGDHSEMTYANPEALVSTEWLAGHLSDPDLRILDCTWHHVSTNLDGRTQYRGRHLPGSVHFDIDHVADRTNPLPHMLPTPEDFAKKV